MATKEEVLKAVEAAFSVAYEPARPSGCGRAYVAVSGDRATINAVSAACKKLGLLFLRKAYGVSGPAIYVGYDNCDGRALGKASAAAESLNASGVVKAYFDAVGD